MEWKVGDDSALIKCAALLFATVEKLRGELAPREQVALRIGLRASHMEEALMLGEAPRAMAHLKEILRLINVLHNTRTPPPDPLVVTRAR